MFIYVKLVNGFKKPLIYKVPAHLIEQKLDGKLVTVPLRTQIIPALTLKTVTYLEIEPDYEIKSIIGLVVFPEDAHYETFLNKLSSFYFLTPLHFYHRIQQFLEEKVEDPEPINVHASAQKPVVLTDEQQHVVTYVEAFIQIPAFKPTLLHGVTGSGKTEVYKNLINQCVTQGKSTILLLPEVSLSLQFERVLKLQLPDIEIYSFHSASKKSEKKACWQALLQGKSILIIGVHIPILLPVSNLGLIIIDEEHEAGFQEKKHPKINSKDCALWRAFACNIPILLGSATPSMTSLYNVRKKKWAFFQLTKRFSGQFPTIKKVLLTEQKKRHDASWWISQELEYAIRQRLVKKEQTIIYINRRGYSFFVQCKLCGFIFECPNCSVSLTLHLKQVRTKIPKTMVTAMWPGEQEATLRCHYCDFKQAYLPSCPSCKAPEKELLKKGIGTQQIVLILKKLFPSARIERADLDSTTQKNWQEIVKQFEQGELDILVGTKTITKGYHFPNVTLVGILWADLTLHFPVYNASETTLQSLIQVAGRAGRLHENSEVVLQIMHDHPIFNFAHEERYINFADSELELRQETHYPPFYRLVCLELKNSSTHQIDIDAQNLVTRLRVIIHKNNLPVDILGPSLPPVSKVQKSEIRHINLKSESFATLHHLLRLCNTEQYDSAVFIVIH
jgi:primosomal protein N' (replication factor Y)